VGTFFNNISWQLPPLMLAGFFSEEVVGLYSPVSRIILLPVSLIGASIAQVFFQRAAELRSQPAELARTAEMIFQRLVSLGLFPSVLLTVAGREVFTVVLGANWSEAGVYAQILAPWMFFLLVSSSLIYIFSVFERQEITLVINVVIFLSRVAALTIGGMLHNIYLALGIWSITGVAIYCGLSVWTMVLSGVPMRASGRSLLRYILYAIPAVALLLPLKLWLGVAPWVMVIVVGVLLVLYYLWALYRDPTLYRYLRSLVRARRPGA
jgi:O-antigen/teichoic acid export membrane protein